MERDKKKYLSRTSKVQNMKFRDKFKFCTDENPKCKLFHKPKRS